MGYVIREPVQDDADDMGAVHVHAWLAAYRGIMPDEYLDGLSVEERATMWREGLANPPRERFARRVAEADDGRVVGFCIVGPEGADEEAVGGELYAINVDPDLSHFDAILPCGIAEHGVTSMVDLGLPVGMTDLDVALWETFPGVFSQSPEIG